MAEYKFKISHPGDTDTTLLILSMDKDHCWNTVKKIPWLKGDRGLWDRGTNSTKFRQWNFIDLENPAGKVIARLPDAPFKLGAHEKGDLISSWFTYPGENPFDLFVVSVPNPRKYRIREVWGGALSFSFVQREGIMFEIEEVNTGARRSYWYSGTGLTIPIPKIPKIPGKLQPSNVPGSASVEGPWNEFMAPAEFSVEDFDGDAELQGMINLGLGSSVSKNVFSFAGHKDNRVGYLIKIDLQKAELMACLPLAFLLERWN